MIIESIKQLWAMATNENNVIIKYIWYTFAVLLPASSIFIKLWPFIYNSNLLSKYKKTLKILSFPLFAVLIVSTAIAFIQPTIYNALHLFLPKNGTFYYHFILIISGITLMILYFIVSLTRLHKKDFMYYDFARGSKYNYEFYKQKRYIENDAFEKFFRYGYSDKQVKRFLKSLKSFEKNSSDYAFKNVTNNHVKMHKFIILISSYFLGLFPYYLYELPFKIGNLYILLGIVFVFIIQFNSIYILNISMKNYDHLKQYKGDPDEVDKEG